MIVRFYGTYRLITEQEEIEFALPAGGTLWDLLRQVKSRFPQLGEEMLDQKGNLYPYIPIYINGRNPRLLSGGLQKELVPEDIVSIFSPIASGHINVEDASRQKNG